MLTGDAAKALEAFKSGQNPAEVVYGESGQDPDFVVEADEVVADNTSPLDSLLGDEQPSQDGEEGSTTEASDSDSESQISEEQGEKDVEEIFVTDQKGRRKVEIDYRDRDKIKKMYQFAHGARKWQAERDQARSELSQLKSSMEDSNEKATNFDALEEAYSSSGIEGIIDLIEGRQGAYQEFLDRELERRDFRRTATPEELDLLDAKEASLKQQREVERLRREMEELRNSNESERNAVELKAMEAKVHPAFDKYRFAGKLGNASDEQIFDEMLWNRSLKALEPYEEQGLDITPAMVDKAFKSTYTALKRNINKQVDRSLSRAVKKKKTEATSNAQSRVMKGTKSSGEAREAYDMIKSGNLTDLIRGFNKYGKYFGQN